MKSLMFLCPLIILSCSSHEKTDENIQEEVITSAISEVHSAKYPKMMGTVSFESVPEGIKVKANFTGLPKKVSLGFHIHQFGACEGPDYKSAGDHYNPGNSKHGGPGHTDKHFGDLGNLVTDAKGKTNYELVIPKTNEAGFEQIIGKSILIHAKKDNLKSQPSGNSGARIACGIVIPIATGKKISLITQAQAEQGTMSTDQSETSSGEASLSGTTDQDIDLREEEVQLQEDNGLKEEPLLEVEKNELDNFEDEMEN